MGSTAHDYSLENLKSLQSSKQQELLNVVDALRAQGLSALLPLPQLVVCGDQSSGKSSVLEAISGIPFPKKDHLCTRFATEVILRRDGGIEATVSIIPGQGRSDSDRLLLLNFRHSLDTLETLADLITQAKEAMGLGPTGNAFSTDILRIEVTGPKMPQLTIVDLPGLIHSENKLQTEADVELVKKLVQSYMKKSRSIILAVVSARNDYANQIILKRARMIDTEGCRTLGIITKPDTLHHNSDSETAFLNLARNQDVHFKLGWHVVRNLGYDEQSGDISLRDKKEEEFFTHSNWSLIEPSTVGIRALRDRLSSVLFDQIGKELPHLVQDIQASIEKAQADLDRLGRSRKTEAEQRLFLIDLSQRFKSLCDAASEGNYKEAFFGDAMDPDNSLKRVRAFVQNDSTSFEKRLRVEGSRWQIVEEPTGPRCLTRARAIERVILLIQRSRGKELPGTLNPLLVGELFREYASPWEGIAKEHVVTVWKKVHAFLELAVRYLADGYVCDALFQFIIDPIWDLRIEKANEKLASLMKDLSGHPITYNHYLTDNVRKQENEDRRIEIRRKLKIAFQRGKLTEVDTDWITSLLVPGEDPDMDRIAAKATLNHMNAYYKVEKLVSMKVFIDNVPIQVLESEFINGLSSVFDPTGVLNMDAELVAKVAGESEERQNQREDLQKKLEILHQSDATCKAYASRVSTGVTSDIGERPGKNDAVAHCKRKGKKGKKGATGIDAGWGLSD
ncbi:MAG: hypothetical protein M1819_004467 [Sarea resinae]|nr:MAG: hypothetical protein M1819_004467 [Sarea resinae]